MENIFWHNALGRLLALCAADAGRPNLNRKNAHVAVYVFLRSLHWRVYGHKRQVGEERFAVLQIAVDKINHLIDQKARRVKISPVV